MTIRAAAAAILLPWTPARAADGDMALPERCASVHVASLHAAPAPASGFDAADLTVQLPHHPPAKPLSMTVAKLSVSSQAVASDAALEQAASAASAALLIGLSGRANGGCPTGQLRDAGNPIADGLRRGGNILATWLDVRLRGGAGQVAVKRMQLRLTTAPDAGGDLSRNGRLVHVTLTLDGIVGSLTPKALLPEHLAITASLAAAALPTLLAATGGNAGPDTQIPLTIDQLRVTHGQTTISGTGAATAAATPLDSTATLHLKAQGFDDLVSSAALLGLVRLHTALLISGLMAKRHADGLSWEVHLQDQVVLVNNVPIPLR